MSTNLPAYNPDALNWLEAHIDQWTADPATIGLTSAVVADLDTDIVAARDAFTSVQHLRAEALAGTSHFRQSGDDMRHKASMVIGTIKAFAQNSAVPSSVYSAAGITPASTPSPLPAPDRPGNVSATLQNDGSITVAWDGGGPTGTVYQIYRKLAGETTFSVVGAAGARNKVFNDRTLPGAIASVTYMIRAQHAEKFSAFSAQTTAQFGGTKGSAESIAA